MKDVFDYAAAMVNLDNDAEIYEAVAEAYIESTPPLFEEMRKAVTEGDLETYHRQAHSLKSSSRTVGGMALGDLAERVEATSQVTDKLAALATVDQLYTEYLVLVAAIKQVVGAPSA